MSRPGADCAAARAAIVDLRLEGRPWTELPSPVADHLRACAACDRFGAGLLRLSSPPGEGRLYTGDLRRRTLAAVASAAEERVPAMLSILVAAAVTIVAASTVGPVWLAARLLEPLLASRWAALGTAVALCTSLGAAAAGACLITLLHVRGQRPQPALHDGWRMGDLR